MNSLLLTSLLFLLALPLSEAAEQQTKDMVWIKPGLFLMGSNEKAFRDTHPVHQIRLDGFWLDKTEVTNAEFQRFVKATQYKTVAERTPRQEDFPNAPKENLVAGSLVFTPPQHVVSKGSHLNWWRYVPGANWQHPYGRKSNISGKDNYPVVQIAYADAEAYAKWAHKRLPTEAEFEYAARGGLSEKKYSWGDVLKPGGIWQANIWQGVFPYENTKEDGFADTAPVGRYPANGYGLYDMTGNVWEWCSDWYAADYYKNFLGALIQKNPKGPEKSLDPAEPNVQKRVQRGGSFLCTDQYCARYMVGARGKGEPDSGSSNVGFRCAMDSQSQALR